MRGAFVQQWSFGALGGHGWLRGKFYGSSGQVNVFEKIKCYIEPSKHR
jgi:hypothetical protein